MVVAISVALELPNVEGRTGVLIFQWNQSPLSKGWISLKHVTPWRVGEGCRVTLLLLP